MGLSVTNLTNSLRKFMDSEYELFEGFPASNSEVKDAWINAYVDYCAEGETEGAFNTKMTSTVLTAAATQAKLNLFNRTGDFTFSLDQALAAFWAQVVTLFLTAFDTVPSYVISLVVGADSMDFDDVYDVLL